MQIPDRSIALVRATKQVLGFDVGVVVKLPLGPRPGRPPRDLTDRPERHIKTEELTSDKRHVQQVTTRTKRRLRFRRASDGRQVLAALGRPPGRGAAFGRHGYLGAEVVAVAAGGGLLILGVSPQEPLQHPSAPLTLNLRLDLKEQRGQTG